MLSVLINNYNYGRFLRDCIDSVLAQDYPDFEVILVDDGSTDDSHAIIASYGDRIVPVIKENGGQASSFNAGFAAARGDILLLLDADDAFLPGKLRRIEELYRADNLDWCFDTVVNEADVVPPVQLQTRSIDMRAKTRTGHVPHLPVPTSGLSFHRRMLEQILPMPLAKDVVLSDNYLKFAAAHLGAGMIVETPLTFQRLHDSNRYTNSAKQKTLKPQIMIATGLHLALRYEGLNRLGQVMVAGGIAGSGLSLPASYALVQRYVGEAGGLGWTAGAIGAKMLVKKLAGFVKGH